MPGDQSSAYRSAESHHDDQDHHHASLERHPGYVVATLRLDGTAVIANLVAPEIMDTLTANLPFDDRTKVGNDFIAGSDNRSIGAARCCTPIPSFARPCCQRRVLGVADRVLLPERSMATSSKPVPREKPQLATSDDGCAQLLSVTSPPERGPYCHHYRVGASASLQARTGGAVQLLHREMAIYEPFVEHGPSSRDFILNMMWAGTDFTAPNGATRLVPGSDRWLAERLANESEVAQAVMPKGSVLFWLSRTLHGLGASNSDARRTGIFHSLVVNWLAQEENQYLAFPPEHAARLSVRARQLLGYRSSGTCGWVKGRDSHDLLAAGASSRSTQAAKRHDSWRRCVCRCRCPMRLGALLGPVTGNSPGNLLAEQHGRMSTKVSTASGRPKPWGGASC